MSDHDCEAVRVDLEWDGYSVLVLGIVALVCALGVLASFLNPSLGFESVLLSVEFLVGSVTGGLALLIARVMRRDGGPAARVRSRVGATLAAASGVGVAAMVGPVIVMNLVTAR